MKRYFAILAFALCCVGILKGQTAADSLTIVSAKWEVTHPQKGIVCKSVSLPMLYNCPQVINMIEIDPGKGMKARVGISEGMKRTSFIAAEHHALAAINGSYFNMKQGNSVCFLKRDGLVIDTTTIGEFNLRVTGAIYERKGKLKLIPWSREIEKKYKRKRGTVLASGPLLLENGKACDWSRCEENFIQTKHPRSAVCTTKDGKILLITVNGRFRGRAEGINIPELAHLLRMLGGKNALNLDGGGSTTLWLSGAPDNGIVNYPCDNRSFDHAGERRVPNIVYIYK